MTQSASPVEPPIFAVVGPTAAGKSELGIEIALRFDGEIINCDSVQVYRRLMIGTAKIPGEERRGIAHHLLDIIEPIEHFTAGAYATIAGRAVAEIESRGKLAIFVGGTGFYLRALRAPLCASPPTDLKLRHRLRRILDGRGPEHLRRLLTRVDPGWAERTAPGDWSRTMRGLEFYFQTGKPLSQHLARRPPPPPFASRFRLIALNPPREILYRRINQRTERMFERGWVQEVRQLLQSGVPPTAKSLGAHGYRRILEYLRGDIPLERAIELTQRDVRHYAKRQITWFRREPNVTWFHGFGDDPGLQASVMARIFEWLHETA